jgi:hypothetical protein
MSLRLADIGTPPFALYLQLERSSRPHQSFCKSLNGTFNLGLRVERYGDPDTLKPSALTPVGKGRVRRVDKWDRGVNSSPSMARPVGVNNIDAATAIGFGPCTSVKTGSVFTVLLFAAVTDIPELLCQAVRVAVSIYPLASIFCTSSMPQLAQEEKYTSRVDYARIHKLGTCRKWCSKAWSGRIERVVRIDRKIRDG